MKLQHHTAMKLACPQCSQTLELTPDVLASLQGQPHFECPSCQGLIATPAQPQRPMPRRAQPQARAAAGQAQRGMNRNLLVLGLVALLVLGGIAAFLASRNGGSITNIFQNTTNNIIHNNYFTQLIASGATTMEDLRSIEEIRPYGDGFIGVSKAQLNWSQAGDLAKRTGSEVLAVEDSAAGTKQQLIEWLKTTFAAQFQPTLWVRQDEQTKVTDGNDILAASSLESTRKVALHWRPNAGRTTNDPALATKEQPFENSLGMKFVPVPTTGGPTDGKRVLFSIWETRVSDYEAFATQVERELFKPSFVQGPTHPVVNVSWDDTQAFCSWLTERERKSGRLSSTGRYRLPSDHEWSCAAGLGDREDPAKQPSDKSEKLSDVFPWGSAWPPPSGTGNYAGEELQEKVSARTYPFIKGVLPGYRDDFLETAPVGSFPADALGLYDLSGNAREWCEDWWDAAKRERVLRGGSWGNEMQVRLLSSHRDHFGPSRRYIAYGFRCVLEVSTPAAATDKPQESAAMRSAAEWVHSIGGRMQISAKGRGQTIQSTDELPAEAFKVTEVLLDGRGKAKITDASLPRLAPLTELVSLKLPAQDIGDDDLHHLANFTELEHLELNWCPQLTGSGLQHLRSLPNLSKISLRSMPGMGDQAAEQLSSLKHLEWLDVTNMKLTNVGLQRLSEIKTLTYLNLEGVSAVSDQTVGMFSGLTLLRELHIAGTPITDNGLKDLQRLTKLEKLTLGSGQTNLQRLKCPVTDAGVSQLRAALPWLQIVR
jgi:hypothetical protein